MEIVQKHIRARDVLSLAHKIIATLQDQEITRDLYIDLLKYIISESDSPDFEGFFEILIKEAPQYKETTMNISERLQEKGFNAGMLQGKLEGKVEAKFAVARNLLKHHIGLEIVDHALFSQPSG